MTDVTGRTEGDPLDHLEGWARAWMASDDRAIVSGLHALADDVLALVAVARAARDMLGSLGNPSDPTFPEGTYSVGGNYISRERLEVLRAALARLEEAR